MPFLFLMRINMMIRKHILFVSLLTLSFYVSAQNFSKDRYTSIEQSTRQYAQKQGEVLRMDIFSPEPDTVSHKPVIVYVHGGGFSGGKRDEERHLQFCRRFARKGYLTITIDYTLHMKGKSFGCDRPSQEKLSTFLKTGQDISRAISYLTKQHKILGIDTTKIILAGSSAGAEAVLHAAFWNKTRIDGNKQILPESFHYGGVISMAGAIANPDWITRKNAVPTMFFHGANDKLVPYGTAPHHYCEATKAGFLMLFGPEPLTVKLKDLEESYFSLVDPNGGHEWNEIPLYENENEITEFLYQTVILGKIQQTVRIENAVQKESNSPSGYLN